jgi:RND family efflux transporter MFP subunit
MSTIADRPVPSSPRAGLVRRLLGVAALAVAGCGQAPPPPAPPPPPVVTTSTPTVDEVSDFEDFTGRTDAVYTIEVRARVTGYLDKVNFEDGSEVKKGEVLFEIDPRPYQSELKRAEATLVQAQVHLKRLEADYNRAKGNFSRGAISREEFDRISGDYNEAVAAVGVAEGVRDLDRLNLGFTKVTAPISGRISRRMVDPGNLVQADQTALTTIVSLDPMYVYFDIDERTLLRLRRLVSEGKIQSRQRGAEVPVMAALADEEEEFPHPGKINFADNKLDPSTGTLRLRAVLPNPEPRYLSPGLFVRVRLPIGKPRKALLIPEQALGTDQGKKFLYVVKDVKKTVDPKTKKETLVGKAVRRDNVTVGLLDKGRRVIERGLSPGEQVIVTGLQRVRPNSNVVISNPAGEAGAATASSPTRGEGGAAGKTAAGG